MDMPVAPRGLIVHIPNTVMPTQLCLPCNFRVISHAVLKIMRKILFSSFYSSEVSPKLLSVRNNV